MGSILENIISALKQRDVSIMALMMSAKFSTVKSVDGSINNVGLNIDNHKEERSKTTDTSLPVGHTSSENLQSWNLNSSSNLKETWRSVGKVHPLQSPDLNPKDNWTKVKVSLSKKANMLHQSYQEE